LAAKCPVWGHGYCKHEDNSKDKAHHCYLTVAHIMHRCKCGGKRR